MSFDVMTLALAKSYADQHGGSGEASTAGDFIIKMTVEGDDDGNYTVTSCDATVEQIDEAVAAEKRIVVITSVDGAIVELPMVQGVQGEYYYFYSCFSESMLFSCVHKDGNTSSWVFEVSQIWSSAVGYSNAALPNISTVKEALDELVPKSHTHANKDTLDKLSNSNGKLQYNGSDISLAVDLASYAKKTEVPTKTSQLTNDSGFLTSHQDISGKQDVITETNKLSYSLLSDTPTIPASASDIGIIEYIAAEIDELWDSI